jgi:hypothetical protein
LASATTTPLTTTRPDPAQSDVPEPTGPPCPSCGFKWPVQVNLPGAAWWCSYCGHRWDP